jgi:putative ABC transport system permease protein
MDRRARRFLGPVSEGMETELAGRRIKVVGTFPGGADFIIDGSIIMSERNFLTFFDDPAAPGSRRVQVDLGVIKVAPGDDPRVVQAALVRALPRDVAVYTKDDLIGTEIAFQSDISPVGIVFGLGAAIGFFVGILIAYQVLFGEIADRLPQYATLKAIGYGRGYVVGVILRQSFIYSIGGFLLALVVTAGLYAIVSDAILIPMGLTAEIFAVTLGMTVVMCALAGLVAARRALTADPADVF